MTVLLPDGRYRVQRRTRPSTDDAHGFPVSSALSGPGPARPGAARREADGTYTLRLDPTEWPVRTHDTVTAADGTTYVITTARVLTNPAASDADYVSATAALIPPDRI